MKVTFARLSGSVIAILTFAIGCSVQSTVDESKLKSSRSLAQTFGMRLKTELKTGLEEGGPVQAIAVCKNVAPQVASELSRQSGAKVARTSLRYRNANNAPEPWQARVLKDFDQQAANKQANAPLEFFKREADGTIRYMKAIRTDGVCLACHGESIPPALQESLDRDYPHDRAVGYSLGDVRGAFSISWPSPDSNSGS